MRYILQLKRRLPRLGSSGRRAWVMRMWTAVLLCLVAGCPGEQMVAVSRFRVRVHCQTQEGKAVPGVLLGSPQGPVRTDGQGNAALLFEGHEGEEISFRVERLPPGLELADRVQVRHIVLKSYGRSELDRSAVSDLQHDVPLRNRKDSYVVFVYADDAPGLSIAANGGVVGKLNSRSAAGFLYEGKPGEELIVAIATGNDPRASEQEPKKTYQLNNTDHLLVFHSSLVIGQAPPPKAKKSGPKSTKPAGPKENPNIFGNKRR